MPALAKPSGGPVRLPRSLSQPGLQSQGARGLPQRASRQPRSTPAPWQSTIRDSRLPGVGSSRTSSRTSSRPGSASRSGITAAALDTSSEILRVSKWSVRKLEQSANAGVLIYVYLPTGQAQEEPPAEVLKELAKAQPEDIGMPEDIDIPEADPGPLFRRIVLGNGCDHRMARDILEALHEDIALFADVQRKFSDFPKEAILQLDELLKTLDMDSLTLDPGEMSEAINSNIGVQILLRVG